MTERQRIRNDDVALAELRRYADAQQRRLEHYRDRSTIGVAAAGGLVALADSPLEGGSILLGVAGLSVAVLTVAAVAVNWPWKMTLRPLEQVKQYEGVGAVSGLIVSMETQVERNETVLRTVAIWFIASLVGFCVLVACLIGPAVLEGFQISDPVSQGEQTESG
ncbi:MAG: hypothetical protein AAGA37_13765 [Actinomycetota bacterium]